MARPLALDTNHPLASVFLRNLAWGKHIVKASNHRRKDIINEHLDAARKELGLPSHAQKSGAPHVFIDNLFKAGLLQKSIDGIELVENEKWEKEWRLLHVPSHDSVRRSSFNPIITDDEVGKLSISLRDTSLPLQRSSSTLMRTRQM